MPVQSNDVLMLSIYILHYLNGVNVFVFIEIPWSFPTF